MDEIEKLISESAKSSEKSAKSPPSEGPSTSPDEEDTLFRVCGILLMAMGLLQYEINSNKDHRLSDGFLETLQDLTDGATKVIEDSASLDISVRELSLTDIGRLCGNAKRGRFAP